MQQILRKPQNWSVNKGFPPYRFDFNFFEKNDRNRPTSSSSPRYSFLDSTSWSRAIIKGTRTKPLNEIWLRKCQTVWRHGDVRTFLNLDNLLQCEFTLVEVLFQDESEERLNQRSSLLGLLHPDFLFLLAPLFNHGYEPSSQTNRAFFTETEKREWNREWKRIIIVVYKYM